MNPVAFNPSALSFQDLAGNASLRHAVQPGTDGPAAVPGLSPAAPSGTEPAPFDNVLGRFVNQVNDKAVAAGDAMTGLLTGQNVALHEAMIAMEESGVSFQLMLAVRNKLLEGYQELMRLNV